MCQELGQDVEEDEPGHRDLAADVVDVENEPVLQGKTFQNFFRFFEGLVFPLVQVQALDDLFDLLGGEYFVGPGLPEFRLLGENLHSFGKLRRNGFDIQGRHVAFLGVKEILSDDQSVGADQSECSEKELEFPAQVVGVENLDGGVHRVSRADLEVHFGETNRGPHLGAVGRKVRLRNEGAELGVFEEGVLDNFEGVFMLDQVVLVGRNRVDLVNTGFVDAHDSLVATTLDFVFPDPNRPLFSSGEIDFGHSAFLLLKVPMFEVYERKMIFSRVSFYIHSLITMRLPSQLSTIHLRCLRMSESVPEIALRLADSGQLSFKMLRASARVGISQMPS